MLRHPGKKEHRPGAWVHNARARSGGGSPLDSLACLGSGYTKLGAIGEAKRPTGLWKWRGTGIFGDALPCSLSPSKALEEKERQRGTEGLEVQYYLWFTFPNSIH